MEFLGGLGVDIKLLMAQLVNFGLLLWLLSKFLYGPIVKRIEKDEKELNEAGIQKKELEKEKAEFAEFKKRELENVKVKAREIIKEAENMAKNIKDRARFEAEQEKEAVIKQIKTRLAKIKNAQ